MDLAGAVASCVGKYATFRGRARRAEYWYWQLFVVLAYLAASIVDAAIHTALFLPLAGVAVLVPGMSVTVRRLHDTERSGWWYAFYLVPVIGYVLLTVWLCERGTRGANGFGRDPVPSPRARLQGRRDDRLVTD